MISRRVFIKNLAGIAPILGGSGMCLSSPLWERWFADNHGGLLYALDPQTGLIDWILGEIGPDIPVHFIRFHPDYQLRNLPPTPVATLERTRETAMGRGIHFVYVGNVPDHPGNHTYCPSCGKAVIKRAGFFIAEMHVKKGLCAFCRRKISGVWT